MTAHETLDFYASPGAMTSAGRRAPLIDPLPGDVAALAGVVQGLAIHEYMAEAYGVVIPDERRCESHIRPMEQMLDRILAIDGRPLSIARPPDRRLVGICRHFATLIVTMLRAKGVPARARSGFGSYFNPGSFEEHVLCEYWNAAQERWVLVDPQCRPPSATPSWTGWMRSEPARASGRGPGPGMSPGEHPVETAAAHSSS